MDKSLDGVFIADLLRLGQFKLKFGLTQVEWVQSSYVKTTEWEGLLIMSHNLKMVITYCGYTNSVLTT